MNSDFYHVTETLSWAKETLYDYDNIINAHFNLKISILYLNATIKNNFETFGKIAIR